MAASNVFFKASEISTECLPRIQKIRNTACIANCQKEQNSGLTESYSINCKNSE